MLESGGGGTGQSVTPAPTRVDFTQATEQMLLKLFGIHQTGFMFHQSGGCCDGSSPMCYPAGEFRVGPSDVLMQVISVPGLADPIPFYMSLEQFEYWRHTHLTIDVVPGRGAGFSLEAPEGVRFLTRSRLFSDAEVLALAEHPVLLGDGSVLR